MKKYQVVSFDFEDTTGTSIANKTGTPSYILYRGRVYELLLGYGTSIPSNNLFRDLGTINENEDLMGKYDWEDLKPEDLDSS